MKFHNPFHTIEGNEISEFIDEQRNNNDTGNANGFQLFKTKSTGFQCLLCADFETNRKDIFLAHIRSKHSNEETFNVTNENDNQLFKTTSTGFQCLICSGFETNRKDMFLHIKENHIANESESNEEKSDIKNEIIEDVEYFKNDFNYTLVTDSDNNCISDDSILVEDMKIEAMEEDSQPNIFYFNPEDFWDTN